MKNLYFRNLQRGEQFKINSQNAKGTVYMKVADVHKAVWMLELSTGKIFKPTKSPVKRVNSYSHSLS